MSYHINYGLGTFLFSSGRSFEGAFFLPVPTTSLCYNLLTSLSHFWICLWSSTLALLDSWYFYKTPLYLYAVAIMILFLLSRLDSIALLGQLLILWFSNIQREWAAITICLVRVCLLFGGRANCLETFYHIPENSLKFILTMPSWKFSGTSMGKFGVLSNGVFTTKLQGKQLYSAEFFMSYAWFYQEKMREPAISVIVRQ